MGALDRNPGVHGGDCSARSSGGEFVLFSIAIASDLTRQHRKGLTSTYRSVEDASCFVVFRYFHAFVFRRVLQTTPKQYRKEKGLQEIRFRYDKGSNVF